MSLLKQHWEDILVWRRQARVGVHGRQREVGEQGKRRGVTFERAWKDSILGHVYRIQMYDIIS